MPADLEGKVVVVTGGADGIGRECAVAYVREKATVAIVDRDFTAAQRTATELNSTSFAVQADVSDGEAVKYAIAGVVRKFGRIDAGYKKDCVSRPYKQMNDTTAEE